MIMFVSLKTLHDSVGCFPKNSHRIENEVFTLYMLDLELVPIFKKDLIISLYIFEMEYYIIPMI